MKEEKPRILCIHSGGAVLRGSELVLLDFLTTMLAMGRELHLLCDQPVLCDRARELGIAADLIPRGEFMIDKGNVQLNLIGLLRSNWRIRREIGRFRPDIVYCNSGRALQMALFAARLARTPTAVHLHAAYARRYLYLYGTTRCDLVLHCSDNTRIVHEQKARFRRSITVVNAIDERRFPSPDQLQRPNNHEPVLGFIGSLIHRKGIDILIGAVRLLHDRGVTCRLRIAGRDEDGQYHALARKLNVPAEFVGEVQRERVAEFFAGVDLHVLPSRMEGLPLTIVEAAFSGVPTIAPRVDGIPEAMIDGKLGMLYEDNTPEQLADRIHEMLQSEWLARNTAAQRSTNIARLARARFALPVATRRLCAALDSLVLPLPAAAPEPVAQPVMASPHQ